MEIVSLLRQQQESLDHFFKTVDPEKIDEIANLLRNVQGFVYFTGVGKSGFICQKISATFISVGIRAGFLSPLDALHGDIGIIQEGDMVVFLSKSGETEELIKLIPHIHSRGGESMSWTCTKNSRLARETNYQIELPLDKELCPFDLAPTTSAQLHLLLGDLIAMAIMQEKKLSKEQYHRNHPAGTIGKKIGIRVDDIMLKGVDIPTVSRDATAKVAILLLTKTRKGCVLVTDEQRRVIGIFTDGDVKRLLSKEESNILNKTMDELMTKSFIAIPQGITAWEAIQIMQKTPEKWVNVAPVTKEDLLVGLITMHDILRHGIR